MTLLDDVLDAQPDRPSRAGAGLDRRRVLAVLAPVVVLLVVLGSTLGGDLPPTSAEPDEAQVARAAQDPCGLVGRPQVASLIGHPLGAADVNGGVGFTQCLLTGLPNLGTTLVDIEVASAGSLEAAGVAPSTAEALRDLREPEGRDVPATPIPDMGDEAWLVDDNQEAVWVRQGALLLKVSVVTPDPDGDAGRAESLARVLLRAIATPTATGSPTPGGD